MDIFDNPTAMMKKLLPYFPRHDEESLYEYLQTHGLAKLTKDSKEDMKQFIEQNIFKRLSSEFNVLRNELNGPDIPIIILPCHATRGLFQKVSYHRGGIAYKNCICLFLSPLEGILQHKAVLLHEYHHIVRLKKLHKNNKVTLLDAMILEGLAETEVLEKYGQEVQAPWTTLYSSSQCEIYFNKYLKDKLKITNQDEQFSKYLYGGNGIPKLLGYGVGYDIVKSCLEQTEWSCEKLIQTSSEKIKDNALNYIAF